jgi:hypothetical protein
MNNETQKQNGENTMKTLKEQLATFENSHPCYKSLGVVVRNKELNMNTVVSSSPAYNELSTKEASFLIKKCYLVAIGEKRVCLTDQGFKKYLSDDEDFNEI